MSHLTIPKKSNHYYDDIPLMSTIPWNIGLAARKNGAIHSGTADTDVSFGLKDTSADFTGTARWSVVRNTDTDEYSVVLFSSGSDTLRLLHDIFPNGDENYEVYAKPSIPHGYVERTGMLLAGNGTAVATTNTTNHLIVSGETFSTKGVSVGDWALNLDTGKVAKVTVVAETDLTLQWDAFPDGNEAYMVFSGNITIDDGDSEYDGFVLPEYNISGRFPGGGFAGKEDDEMQQITGSLSADNILGRRWGATYTEGAIDSIISGSNAGGSGTTATWKGFTFDSSKSDAMGGARTSDQTKPRNIREVMITKIKTAPLVASKIYADEIIAGGTSITPSVYKTGWINRSDWTNVHLGSDTTKNVDSNVVHNLDADLADLDVKVLISTDGTDVNSFEVGASDQANNVGQFGFTIFQVSENEIKIQTGSYGIVYMADANGNGAFIDSDDWYYQIVVSKLHPSVNFNVTTRSIVDTNLLYIEHQKSGHAGSFSSGSWVTRELNTVVTNEITGASLASNQITLPAGTYEVDASAPACSVDQHTARLYDITNSETLIWGTAGFANDDYASDRSYIFGRITLTAETVIEVQHRCYITRSTFGLGMGTTGAYTVDHDTFATIKIRKLD